MKKYLVLFLFLPQICISQIYETNETHNRKSLPSSYEIWQAVLAVLAILGITYGIAAMRKGTSQMSKPSNILSLNTAISIEKAMKIIIQYANQSGYKIDDFNESKSIIILSNSASLTSYGFFFPVYLTKQNDSETHVELGIKSKLFQWGPIVRRNQEKCFNGIKAALFANQ